MKAIMAILVVAVALAFAAPAMAAGDAPQPPEEADFCIPYWAGTFDECDPENGEPPEWCNSPGLRGMAIGFIKTDNKVGAAIALAKAGLKAPRYK